MRVEQPAGFLALLHRVFAGRKAKNHTIGDDDGIGEIKVARDPSWFEYRILRFRVGDNFERHNAAVRIVAIGDREFWTIHRRRPPDGHEQPRLAFAIARGRDAAPDADAFATYQTIVAQTGRCVERGLMIARA